MTTRRLASLTFLAMLAFAGNSLLCRAAFHATRIDAASFTSLRLAAGAIVLAAIVRLRGGAGAGPSGSWPSAFALFVYAAAFSFAYVSLGTATGALLLFGAVQATMIGAGLWRGERLRGGQWLGFAIALGGLVGLLLPGLSAPSPAGAALMIGAGMAWGVYSLRGSGGGDPTAVTAGNFARALPFALVLGVAMAAFSSTPISVDPAGAGLAIASGALTSGIGYAVWYGVLPALRATTAASVQLSVPVIAAVGGIALLGEPPSWRLAGATLAILGGIGLVIADRRRAAA